MKSLKLFEILKSTGGICHEFEDCVINEITTDSRQIPENSLFIALKGENFDGNAFVESAFNKGALACIANKSAQLPPHKNLILVEDTGKALLDLAAYYRSLFLTKIVAVTGSVGKTTTKEMIWAVLSHKFNTLKTIGNLNNLIGLPKTLFNLTDDHNAAVLEMGMSELLEISQMSKCARPDIGVVTTVGVSHLETLKTRENILKAKMEITHGMKNNTPLIINVDNDLLSTVSSTAQHVISYGIYNENAQIKAKDITSDSENTFFTITTDKSKIDVSIPAIGEHNVYNALAAYAVGKCFFMSDSEIAVGLKNYSPSGMRQRLSEVRGIKVVEDCYNASPDSMTAALKTLSKMNTNGKKIAVLGDMLELGEISKDAHFKMGELVSELNLNAVCFGEMAQYITNGANKTSVCATHFQTKSAAAQYLRNTLKEGDVVWFKASRGMKFEEIIEEFSK
jgi:UDP-N-acetylmuramoyl-tripeptide--D-alanyl-D-alanine ligase